jgi:hypothetical protein
MVRSDAAVWPGSGPMDFSGPLAPWAGRWEAACAEEAASEAGAASTTHRSGWLRRLKTLISDPDQMLAAEALRMLTKR